VSFIMPPFWAQGSGRTTAPHAVAVPVTPAAVTIVASTVAAATVLDTLTPHYLVSGDTVLVAGHAGSTPAVNGARVVTVIDSTHVSVPVTVTVAGAGGTLARTIAVDPLTLAQGKLRAGLDWADGDPRDALMLGFIAAARSKVERDTGLSLLPQTFDVFFDALPSDRTPIALPWRPVIALASIVSVDSGGVIQTLATDQYHLDAGSAAPVSARVGLSLAGGWPTDLRSFQPYVLRIVAGFASVALIPPLLIEAMGMLIAHSATTGRDRFTDALTRDEYAEKIASYELVVVA
jgi:uncharacterized phiE125 gp8 family phage protein